MPAAVGGELRLVLCAPATHAGHEHGSRHDHSPPCVYSLSAGPAPLPVLAAPPDLRSPLVARRPVRTAEPLPGFGPTREQAARGPPLLS
jgi:hypothetical protein